jgi:histidinol-phosphatase (PHP family)
VLADYHIHTPYCGHAKGKIIDYVHAAIAAGLQEIGFSDHLGRYYLTKPQKKRFWDWGMDERNVARYVAELLDLREIFQDRIAIKIGLEVDYVEGVEDLIGPLVSQYPFDYLLGSVHCLPQLGWQHLSSYAKAVDTSAVYKEYFRVVRAALQSGVFNVLAHPDFIWRYIDWPRDASMPFDQITELVRTAAQSNHVLEINANAFLWSQANPMENGDPFDTLLDRIKEYRVPVSLGSDAHEPGMVGKFFPEIIALLKKKGITSFICFTDGIGKAAERG